MNLVIILGSVRDGRMVERVSKLVANSVKKCTEMSSTFLDPVKVDPSFSLNRQPIHFLSNIDSALPWMKTTREVIRKADGFIVLTSEYNGNVPPALLNLMNSFPPTLFRHRPAGIVTYTMGTTGAMRALSTTVRPYLSEFGLLCVPGYVPIPMVHEAVDDSGNCNNQLVNQNLEKLVRNVEWYSHAIMDYRNKNPHVD